VEKDEFQLSQNLSIWKLKEKLMILLMNILAIMQRLSRLSWIFITHVSILKNFHILVTFPKTINKQQKQRQNSIEGTGELIQRKNNSKILESMFSSLEESHMEKL